MVDNTDVGESETGLRVHPFETRERRDRAIGYAIKISTPGASAEVLVKEAAIIEAYLKGE
jgi:hypothetical protein